MNCCKILTFIIFLQFLIFTSVLYNLLNEISSLTAKQEKPDGVCLTKPKLGLGLSTITPSKTEFKNTSQNLADLAKGSSVYCYGKTKRDRVCRFQNLCYQSKWNSYVFFHGPWSHVRGVPKNRFDPALLDLTSVDDHNTKYFNYVDFLVKAVDEFQEIEFVESTSLLFHRFNPENLMHVVHDDLIPLFVTLKRFVPLLVPSLVPTSNFNIQLLMMDGRAKGPWFQLYKQFTNKPVLFQSNLQAELTCFREVIVGLSKDTTWYQYGFHTHQGPIEDTRVEKPSLDLFVKYLRHKLNCVKTASKYVVLVSRKRSRMILNQVELSMSLANLFQAEVLFLDLEDSSVADAICLVGNADALVGMHGAELILSLFLPLSSTLVELFPYGVNPEHYTPYKTLAALLNLTYVAWKNTKIENTKTFPERPAFLGGIKHLNQQQQYDIANVKEVPRHICCDNPYWLFRIYQDTYIDIPSFEDEILAANVTKTSNSEPQLGVTRNILFPDRVRSISCFIKRHIDNIVSLLIRWEPPVNANQFSKGDLQYQVIIQEKNDNKEVVAYEMDRTEFEINKPETSSPFNVWIRCKMQGKIGPLSGTVKCIEE